MASIDNNIANSYWESNKKGSSYSIGGSSSMEQRRKYIQLKYIKKTMIYDGGIDPYTEIKQANKEGRKPQLSYGVGSSNNTSNQQGNRTTSGLSGPKKNNKFTSKSKSKNVVPQASEE